MQTAICRQAISCPSRSSACKRLPLKLVSLAVDAATFLGKMVVKRGMALPHPMRWIIANRSDPSDNARHGRNSQVAAMTDGASGRKIVEGSRAARSAQNASIATMTAAATSDGSPPRKPAQAK